MVMKIGSAFSASVHPASGPRRVTPPIDLDETLPLGQTTRIRPAPETLPMRCLCCQGPVHRATAPVKVDRDGYKLAWEQVPAWVCSRCEMPYFERQEVETVRKAVRALRRMGVA
jgi:YgiT-type zinc finger domain-containing protein